MLALHGLTGHGRRWETLAERHLPDVEFVAPDLLGHGRSSWAAPWTTEANVAALVPMITEPLVVVGHSFGGAIALHLAAKYPHLVTSLVLFDPAAGLDGQWMREIAQAMFASPDYTDAAEARSEKSNGSWSDVDAAELDAELCEHLVTLPTGRVGWRVSIPAIMSYWSELARDITFPSKGIPVTVVRALKTSPPYVTETLIAELRDRSGTDFRLIDLDCNHMVPQAKPAETAQIIRAELGR